MLAQALHSGDVTLLESCFQVTNVPTIRSSVRKLPSQLAVPLLAAVLDRLGKGSKASGQRGAMLILWVKETLSFHTAYLLSVRLLKGIIELHLTSLTRFLISCKDLRDFTSCLLADWKRISNCKTWEDDWI